MSTMGPGVSPNKESATGKVREQPPKKIFRSNADGGVNSKAPKAPQLRPGQFAKNNGK